ncbi:MAG: hypothetical protein L0241_31080 [Planctomycetia bacterium]|nr:hypothetical protein [Planctomycetia bacterium]
MFRKLIVAAVAAVLLATPAEAKRAIRIFTPLEKVAQAEVVITGKVSALEKDTVMAPQFPGGEKVAHKIAVIKIEKGLYGAENVTHIKVGFVPPPPPANPPAPPVRPIPGRGFAVINLTEGQEGLYFLSKHHTGEFYTIHPMLAPLDPKADGYKAQAELVTKATTVLADPMKALKAAKADDRFFAAMVLVAKYRSGSLTGVEMETVKLAADESKLILKALAEGNWKPDPMNPNAPNPFMAFGQLGLTAKDGFKAPQVKPGEDYLTKMKEAYTTWLAGPGKDYQINKLVPKKKK